jgi:hypothetical protein
MADDEETDEQKRKRLAVQAQNPVSSALGYGEPRTGGYGGILQHLGELEPRDPRYTARRNGRNR